MDISPRQPEHRQIHLVTPEETVRHDYDYPFTPDDDVSQSLHVPDEKEVHMEGIPQHSPVDDMSIPKIDTALEIDGLESLFREIHPLNQGKLP